MKANTTSLSASTRNIATILAIALVSIISACSGNESAQPVPTDSIVAPPTAMPDTFVVEEPKREPAGPIGNPAAALAYMNSSPDSALYAAGVIPLIAIDAPKYAEKLLNSTYDRFMVADKGSLYVYLYDRWGREIKRYRMCAGKGIGTKLGKGDSRTPEGLFTVEGIYDSTDWLFTDDNGVTSKVKGQFGPRFIRLRTPVSMQIGIHGTRAPWSLGGRFSHGCMRISNESILELAPLAEPGMIVIVNPGKRDAAVNETEGNNVVRLTLYVDPSKLPDPLPVAPVVINDSIAVDSLANDSILAPASIPTTPDSLAIPATKQSAPLDSLKNTPASTDSIHNK